MSNVKSILLQISLVAIIVIGYFAIDFNSLYQSFKGKANYVVQNQDCSLRLKPCEVIIQDGTKFTLEVMQKDIPLMKPLTFKITSNKNDLNDLKLNIYATNMFMGEFSLPIINLGGGNYEAIGTLPTCPVGDMKWNADIKIDKISKSIGARFQFKTDI